MTEYDYSPEAYERYLRTQQRIAKWVDKTEVCRPQFADAIKPPTTHMPGYESPQSRPKHSPHRSRYRSRSSTPHSSDDEAYGRAPYAPGPMPPMRSAPGHSGAFPQHQMPYQYTSPLASPPLVSPQGQMPPSYYGTPSIQQVKAQKRSRSYQPPPPLVLSPPVSPGVYPQGGYVMMPQQQQVPMPIMSPPPVPNSAPAHVTSFTVANMPPPVTAPPSPTEYFQTQLHQEHASSFSSLLAPPPANVVPIHHGVPIYAYSSSSAAVSPPQSAYPEVYTFTPMVSPPAMSPMYPQVAISPPTPATSPTYSYIYPSTGLHQRVYEMTGHSKHVLRRSVG
ncbi:hypothetical protein CC1G_10544 [Coprinopsis cinerea okayama7|uniref:Uncharacterized protein n=1 Tax=Coprinopsis cinerea (strain Okayama-7 / 130 / ATCC MYA-4618 / FGSC 9003) TaxID=240176 RepID=A8N1C3_COPC7|nr:hypothetical protein CC1G_10544 [Coprinopsis cinerea okayama7\|eukprot:XP_001828672.2 hypothetical protein CC1G_10544 [Coprinopsis cinerea okayama7\